MLRFKVLQGPADRPTAILLMTEILHDLVYQTLEIMIVKYVFGHSEFVWAVVKIMVPVPYYTKDPKRDHSFDNHPYHQQ